MSINRTGSHISITNSVARVVGRIATKHPEATISIDWRDGEPEMFWFVTAGDGGDATTVYAVDDESGTYMALSGDQQSRFEAGEVVFEEG